MLSAIEVSKLEFALERCQDQRKKVNELNQQIFQNLEESSELCDEEEAKIKDNDFKFGSIIKAIQKAPERHEQSNETFESQADYTTDPRLQTSGLKLPKLTFPTFHDKYTDWIPFWDLFKSTIDNNRTLNNIQNLHYLKSSLKDEPVRLLSRLPTTNANYKIAIKLLIEDRYANKRMIIHDHLEPSFGFRPMKEESAERLRKLISVSLKIAWHLMQSV